MVDVARSRADLLTLFADNAVGAISEQDLRDYVVSTLGEFAEIQITSGVTSQVTSATPAKMTGWLADGLNVGPTPDYTNNEITINTAGVYRVDIDVDFSGTNSKTYLCAVYKDVGAGYVDAGLARFKRKLGTGGDVGSAHMHGHVSLAATDKIAVYVWSTDGGTAFVPQEAAFTCKRVF